MQQQHCGLFMCTGHVKRFSYGTANELEAILLDNLGGSFYSTILQSQKISLWMTGSRDHIDAKHCNLMATRVWNDEQCWLDTPHFCENLFGNVIFLGNIDRLGAVNGLSDYEVDFLESFQ
jgi:hypothetical protein